MAKKKKKSTIAVDGTLRTLVTGRIRALDDDEESMSPSERAALCDAIVGVLGQQIVGIIDGAILLATAEADDDDDDDDDDGEEEE
jgi:hypothetical protein